MSKSCCLIIGVILLMLAPCLVQAGTISNLSGTVTVGIGPNGELFDLPSNIGFQRISDSYDPLQPGTPRDSWGISNSNGSAYADQAAFGANNITGTTATYGPNSASLVTTTSIGDTITQNYSFAPGANDNILVINTLVDGPVAMFQRDVDWDVDPTWMDENSFAYPVILPVIDSSYRGFENPDPTVLYNNSCAAGCNQTGDLGGGIKLGINLSTSASFTYYYGISKTGEDVNGLIGQVQSLGGYYWVATQSSENGAYPNLGTNSAIIAVAIPEPATLGFLAVGLALIGAGAMRRRKSA